MLLEDVDMTNYERHRDEIIKCSFIQNECNLKRELIGIDCRNTRCYDCGKMVREWLEAEYVKPEVDWSKVEQGTEVYALNDIVGEFVSKYNKAIVLYIDGCYHGYHESVCRLEK